MSTRRRVPQVSCSIVEPERLRGKFASEAQPLDSLFYKTDDENMITKDRGLDFYTQSALKPRCYTR